MDEVNSEYGYLLSEVKWLSRGWILERFNVCLPQILLFLESKNKYFPLLYPLKTLKYKLGPEEIPGILGDRSLQSAGEVCFVLYKSDRSQLFCALSIFFNHQLVLLTEFKIIQFQFQFQFHSTIHLDFS